MVPATCPAREQMMLLWVDGRVLRVPREDVVQAQRAVSEEGIEVLCRSSLCPSHEEAEGDEEKGGSLSSHDHEALMS